MMMRTTRRNQVVTLDEAIKHCEEVHLKLTAKYIMNGDLDCKECAEEHRRLAEWLKELQTLRSKKGDTL